MKQTYQIAGMTCMGCKASVEEKLNTLAHVNNVSVNLETGETVIETEKEVSLKDLKEVLPNKYTINLKKTISETTVATKKEQGKLTQLKPLFLILFYITVSSILINYKKESFSGFMLDFMGLFYIVFSFFKMLDLKGFPESFRMYDPLAKKIPLYAKIYPFIETVLGIMFLMRIKTDIALITTLIILGITTVGVTKTLLDKKSIRCACLGTALKLPMTEATFIENAIMIVMSVWILLI
ncbi:heavy-metal-associated domain-containing protein [Ochrovirga pacifica]|uniref:heavy-metal-associated domain-containing protein n=1 Tax=Ochrovirga pacifica TaxID=1042376 RepID=UPI0002557FCA|nr:MauE/DoxX family redox-associated membrane protein [Ochrovirga pacifica]